MSKPYDGQIDFTEGQRADIMEVLELYHKFKAQEIVIPFTIVNEATGEELLFNPAFAEPDWVNLIRGIVNRSES